jgi:hypothetical protein
MQAHSYTGRIAPDFPLIPYPPRKPETRPCGSCGEAEKPTYSRKEQYPQQGSKPISLGRTH